MKSTKRRTTSSSGSSARSTSKGTSRQAKSSSRSAPASFEAVFGAAENPQLTRLRINLQEAKTRLETHIQAQPTATAPALFKTRWYARKRQLERLIMGTQEAIDYVIAQTPTA